MSFARRMARVTPSATMELIKTTAAGDYISFASGLPAPSLFPVETVRDLADQVLTRDGRAALQYGPAEGFAPLRAYVAEMLRSRGLRLTPEQVLVTTGSQQALDLAARALLDPGDPVVLESPSYLAALQAFDSCEAAYRTVPMDESGMVVDALPPLLPGSKLVYTLPNFQNPTGFTLPLDRRRALAEAAVRAGVAVVEDDAYSDLRYQGERLPAVAGLAENPWALYTGTFSKVLAPGIRVGYLCGAAEVVSRIALLKQVTDLHTGSLTQRIAYEFCVQGHLETACARLCEVYRSRRDVMLQELQQHLAGVVRWTRPEGGMFIWMTLPDGQDASALLQAAMERGVLFVPGSSFHPDGRGANTLRLNFVSAREPQIRQGIRILAEVIRHSLA